MSIATLLLVCSGLIISVLTQSMQALSTSTTTDTLRFTTIEQRQSVSPPQQRATQHVLKQSKTKKSPSKKNRNQLPQRDSLRITQQKERVNAESWQIFRMYAEDNLDTIALYSTQHPFAHPQVRSALLNAIIPWLGTRYGTKISGESRRLDCSLFTAIIMRKVLEMQLLHGSPAIASQVQRLKSLKSIQFGDLVFFTGSHAKSKKVGHVGMYIANGVFAHASIQKGVIFSHWQEPYYAKRFLFAGTIHSH
jgi:cell wall-associated NlpC family hydrolase